MKIQSLPCMVYPCLSSVVIVKMIRPALVMTPIVEEISKIVCHVPEGNTGEAELVKIKFSGARR
jgi:hypothetical protein